MTKLDEINSGALPAARQLGPSEQFSASDRPAQQR
jgi:hypothetical protein